MTNLSPMREPGPDDASPGAFVDAGTGVLAMARAQLALQREVATLRAQNLALARRQAQGGDGQARRHIEEQLREAHQQIARLRKTVGQMKAADEGLRKRLAAERGVAGALRQQLAAADKGAADARAQLASLKRSRLVRLAQRLSQFARRLRRGFGAR